MEFGHVSIDGCRVELIRLLEKQGSPDRKAGGAK